MSWLSRDASGRTPAQFRVDAPVPLRRIFIWYCFDKTRGLFVNDIE